MEATLVLESRGLAPQLRSTAFSAMWSRLYQADDYVLDISCRAQGRHSSLQGHVMRDSGLDLSSGQVTLIHRQEELSSATLDAFGQFQMDINVPGRFELRVDMADRSFDVSDLRIE